MVPPLQSHQGFHLFHCFVLQLGLLQAHHIGILGLHKLLHGCWVLHKQQGKTVCIEALPSELYWSYGVSIE